MRPWVIFCNSKVSIFVNKLCIKRKNTIIVQWSSLMSYHQTIYVLIKKKKSYFSALQLQYSIHESIRIACKKQNKKKNKDFPTLDGGWNFENVLFSKFISLTYPFLSLIPCDWSQETASSVMHEFAAIIRCCVRRTRSKFDWCDTQKELLRRTSKRRTHLGEKPLIQQNFTC